MAFSSEDQTFSMLDFFLYLAPGTLVLLGLFFFIFDIPPAQSKEFSNLAVSILAIIFAYILGHAVYPLNFLIRNIIHFKLKKKEEKEKKKKGKKITRPYEQDYFSTEFEKALITHTEFCLAQLLRYRSLSRFLTALVIPSLFFVLGIAFNLCYYKKKPLLIVSIPILLGLLAVWGFLHRYERYWYRIKSILNRCKLCR